MAWKLGKNGRLYTGIAGSTAATLVNNLSGDVDLSLESEEASTSVRELDWEFTDIVRQKASISFEVNVDETDTVVADLLTAWAAGTALAFLFKTSVSGSIYFDADFVITKADIKQPKNGHQTVSFTIKPTYTEGRSPALTS